MSRTVDQTKPHQNANDLNLPHANGPGHGAGAMGRPPRRGVLVTVRCLKRQGVSLSVTERRQAPVIVGELKLRRVHDPHVEHSSVAEILDFNDGLSGHLRYFPSRLLVLLNPEILWLDARGMVIYGIERTGGEVGPSVSHWQTWQVAFGKVDPGPPF